MNTSGGGSVPSRSARTVSRARRLRWAVALAALAGAGAMTTAQAAGHDRAMGELQVAVECASGVRLGYEVDYAQEIGSFAVTGMVVKSHLDGCAGREVVVVLADSAGVPLASGSLTVVDGAILWFDTESPVDARDVASVQVLANL